MQASNRIRRTASYLITCFLFLFLLIAQSCKPAVDEEAKPDQVQYFGALKNIMHKGDLSTQVSLKELAGNEYLYALGAMTNLKGEIQIFNTEALNSKVSGDSLVIDTTFDNKATLLVYAQVESWDSIQLTIPPESREDLEALIFQKASERNIDVSRPFPFLLDGEFAFIDWHVINWRDGDTEHSHEKHIQSGIHGRLTDQPAQILGFFSKKHKGIFTHHTVYSHMHFRTYDYKISGHVDGLSLSENILLLLPARDS